MSRFLLEKPSITYIFVPVSEKLLSTRMTVTDFSDVHKSIVRLQYLVTLLYSGFFIVFCCVWKVTCDSHGTVDFCLKKSLSIFLILS